MRTSLIKKSVKVQFRGNVKKFPDCVITPGEALVPYKHTRFYVTPIPAFHRCGPGFPRRSFTPSLSISASHLLLHTTLPLQSVLFLNQSNVVILYPAKECVCVCGGVLRHHAKGTMSKMKNGSSNVSRDTNLRVPSLKRCLKDKSSPGKSRCKLKMSEFMLTMISRHYSWKVVHKPHSSWSLHVFFF